VYDIERWSKLKCPYWPARILSPTSISLTAAEIFRPMSNHLDGGWRSTKIRRGVVHSWLVLVPHVVCQWVRSSGCFCYQCSPPHSYDRPTTSRWCNVAEMSCAMQLPHLFASVWPFHSSIITPRQASTMHRKCLACDKRAVRLLMLFVYTPELFTLCDQSLQGVILAIVGVYAPTPFCLPSNN